MDFTKYTLLVDAVLLFIGFGYITAINTRLLWVFLLCPKNNSSKQIMPILLVHIGFWWLTSLFGVILNLYLISFWRPDNAYNLIIYFALNMLAYATLYAVYVSRFFLTLERISIIKLPPSKYAFIQKVIVLTCMCTSFLLTFIIGTYLTMNQLNRDTHALLCWTMSCIVGLQAYSVTYNISNGISFANFFLSVYCLYLFRKTAMEQIKNGARNQQKVNMHKVIKFTIIIDLLFDVIPQIVTVSLYWIGLDIQVYLGPFLRVLFVVYGISVNWQFYVSFVKDSGNKLKSTNHSGITVLK